MAAAVGDCFNHLSRESSDIDRLVHFYQEIFGLERIESPKFEFKVIWLRQSPSFCLHLIERDPQTKLPEGPWSAKHDSLADQTKLFSAKHKSKLCFEGILDFNLKTNQAFTEILQIIPNSGKVMAVDDSSQTPIRLEGKLGATIICWILGLGSLIAWNSLTSVEDYYYDVFPDYHPSRVLTLVYQPFAFGTMAYLAYNESKINTRRRNIIGYVMFFLATLALLLLDIATHGKGSIGSYMGICLFVAAFGVADALIQGGMLGDLALMCPEFTQSFLAGMAASGALTSALRLFTEAVFTNIDTGLRKGAILFLSISTIFEFLCIFLYAFVFTKLPIVKHYRRKAALEGSQTVSSDLFAAGVQTDLSEKLVNGNLDRLSNKELLFQNLDYALDLFLIFVLTLSVFPGFLYENTGQHQLGSWYPLVLVATFNVWDLISRYIPLIQCLKLESRKGILILVMLRFLLIPAFYFTAKYGDQGWMIMLVSVLGLTNGYLAVCVLMVAPKGYKGPEQNALGNLLVFFLLGGIFLGAALDWLWLLGNGSF